MPSHEGPFHKWDALDDERNNQTRSSGSPRQTPVAKLWMLRLGWIVSTGTLVLGGLLMILMLSGNGHWIGL